MVTAIIPVYHNEKTLYQSLDRMIKYEGMIDEVVMVYDGYAHGNRLYHRFSKQISIYPDIPWGNSRARNIGAINAANDWLLFIDVDHFIEDDVMCDFNPQKVYKFKRVLDKTVWHCNTMLMHKDTFFSVGGYDERFCGHYGYEDRYLHWKLEKAGYDFENLETEVKVIHSGSVNLERDKTHNKRLFNKLINV